MVSGAVMIVSGSVLTISINRMMWQCSERGSVLNVVLPRLVEAVRGLHTKCRACRLSSHCASTPLHQPSTTFDILSRLIQQCRL